MRVIPICFENNKYDFRPGISNDTHYYCANMPNQADTVSFTAKTISTSYGVLSKITQGRLGNLRENLGQIQALFHRFAHYPQKAIQIKDGYPHLLQKNRNAGLAFKMPDSDGIITIRALTANPNLLKLIVQKDGQVTHFITDGTDKVVANVNQKNPQFLPRKFRYMQPLEIKSSNVEEYIAYADDAISKYNEYLSQFRNATMEEVREASVVNNVTKAVEEEIPEKFAEQADRRHIRKIMNLFLCKPKELPEHIKPIVGSRDNVLGFSVNRDDGSVYKVIKKINSKYNADLVYLSIEKINPSGENSLAFLDLKTYKFLKIKDGKPSIREHAVLECSDETVKRNGLSELAEDCYREIFRNEKPEEKIITKLPEKTEEVSVKQAAEQPKPIKRGRPPKHAAKPEKENAATAPVVEPEKPVPSVRMSDIIPAQNMEELTKTAVEKAQADAKIVADLYIKTFREHLTKLLKEQMADFSSNIESFFKG